MMKCESYYNDVYYNVLLNLDKMLLKEYETTMKHGIKEQLRSYLFIDMSYEIVRNLDEKPNT